MSVNYHPLDFDALQKGDVLAPDTIEKITGRQSGSKQYELAILQLRQRIMRELADRQRHATVVCDGGCLRILTDEEAAEYNTRQFKIGTRKLYRSHSRLMHVDVSVLTHDQREKTEREVIIQGKTLSAMRSAKQLALNVYKRSTPGLPAPQ